MLETFADTSGFISVVDKSDAYHERGSKVARAIMAKKCRIVTTDFVLVELANSLAYASMRARLVQFITDTRRKAMTRIVPVSSELLAEGWSLFSQRPDKERSLTDCISFVVMSRDGIQDAFTSDRHFQQAGFKKPM